MKPFSTIGHHEMDAIRLATYSPLSGYLAGRERGGHNVVELEHLWQQMFHVKHAIAVNSATSGLLAAAFAVRLRHTDRFACSPLTMSATAAAPMFTGAKPLFLDVDTETFALDDPGFLPEDVKAIFITNLFGIPAQLKHWQEIAEANGIPLIEDNSQSPFAMERGKYAGTVGTIGVWSLNIHKPIQCGEGGIVTTDDDELATIIRHFINHGENSGDRIGLNLRMPELCAAVARVQLWRGPEIIADRVAQAERLIAEIGNIPGITMPVQRSGCANAWYTVPFLIDRNRAAFCAELRKHEVPIVEGYVRPLYKMPAFWGSEGFCPVAEDIHDRRLFYFENCAWSPTLDEIAQIGDAFRKAAATTL